MSLRVASVCSGIGGAELAFDGLGTHVFAAETEAFPRAVLRHHFPGLHLYGDFRDISHAALAAGPASAEPADVLVGGTPCQSFSVAGLRRGMADERGNLALEYLRLVDRLRPRWVVWENVPGVLSSNGGRDFGAFLGGLGECGYGWAYRCLDAQHFGLAQRRKRVFVVGCAGDWRRAAAVLFEPASLRGDTAPRREAGQGTAPTLASRATAGGGLGTDGVYSERSAADCDGGLIADPISANEARTYTHEGKNFRLRNCVAYGGNNTAGSIDVATAVNAHGGPHGRLDFDSETFICGTLGAENSRHTSGLKSESDMLVAHSLRADGFDASEDGTGRGTPLVAQRSLVRRLTPGECEKLMGLPPDWTLIPWRGGMAKDGPRYRALGNAFAVPVVRWIARRIAREHAQSCKADNKETLTCRQHSPT